MTIRGPDEPGPPDGIVVAPPPDSRIAALARFNPGFRPEGPRLPGETFAGEAALSRQLLEEAKGLDDARFIELAYARVFGRPVDADGARHYAEKLVDGSLRRPELLRELLRSHEMQTPFPHPAAGGDMAADWDSRARDDARFFIASGDSGTEDEFRRSGERDLEEVVLNGLDVEESAEVLEIGCGVGRLLAPLSRRVGRAVGVDISPAMIERARAFCAACPNVRVEVTDGTLASWPSGSFDLVYSYLVFQHVPAAGPIARYVREAARVLRSGGVCRFQVDGRFRTASRPGTYEGVRLSPVEVRGMVADAGLAVRSEWGEDTHYYWIDAQKGRPDGSAPVRIRPRRLDEEFVSRLLGRAGVSAPRRRLAEIGGGSASLRAALGEALDALPAGDVAFVRGLFDLLLGRAPRQDEETFHGRTLSHGWGTRDDVVDAILTCGEFMRLARPDLPPRP